MLTKTIALTKPRELWHLWKTNSDGTPMRCRANGQCITWKTRPDAWVLPAKRGLRDTFRIGTAPECDTGPEEWCLPSLHAAERELFRDLIPEQYRK